MILDDGTYTSVFDVPDTVPGFTIRSASGNPYKYVCPLSFLHSFIPSFSPLLSSIFLFPILILYSPSFLIGASWMEEGVWELGSGCQMEKESCT